MVHAFGFDLAGLEGAFAVLEAVEEGCGGGVGVGAGGEDVGTGKGGGARFGYFQEEGYYSGEVVLYKEDWIL